MKEITNFSNVMLNAIEHNILTNADLKDSSLAANYWLACHDLSQALVRANLSRTEKARSLNAWSVEDVVSEFTIWLEKKFDVQVNAILNPKHDKDGNVKKHNFNGYTTTMLVHFLNDSIAKYTVKEVIDSVDANNKKQRRTVNKKIKDDNGAEHNIYWTFDSMSRPISDGDDLTLGDTISSDKYQPETMSITKAESDAAKKGLYEYLCKLGRRKQYLGSLYVFIEDRLCENDYPSTLRSVLEIFNNIEAKSPAFQIAAQEAFIRAYNKDLATFVRFAKVKGINIKETNLYAKSFNDFGSKWHIDEATISHRRTEYKKTLANIMGVEIPKKFTKKSNI